MHHLAEKAARVLHLNWRDEFTIPCDGLYPFQWFWDSGFIALGWAHIDLERAIKEINSLLKGQWKNGFIPHIIFHNESDSYYPGPEVHAAYLSDQSPEIKTSGITQPPVLGFILEAIYDLYPDDEKVISFIKDVYPSIFRNHHYFYTHRDLGNEGLVYICHNWEAGTDNTPVWDFIWETFEAPEYEMNRRDTTHVDASHRPTNKEYHYYIHLIELFKEWKYDDSLIAEHSPFLVQDPLFNSMLIKSNESMIRLGKVIGRDDMVAQLLEWHNLAKDNFNRKLFDRDLGAYVYYDLRNERYLNHISSSSFAPLFAGIPSPEQAEILNDHLVGGRFGGEGQSNYLCASFDPGSSLFNSKKYWRGPIWINLNWIVFKGLKRYGLDEAADTVRNDTLELLEKYGFYEYFEPSKTINAELQKGYGGNNFSWSAALAIDIIKSNTSEL